MKNNIAAIIRYGKSEKPTILQFNKKDTNEINWIDAEEEFIYHGKRYDVIKIVDDTDSISIHCIRDSEEDKLFNVLETFVDNQVIASNNVITKKTFSSPIKLYFLNHITCFVTLYETSIHASSLNNLFYESVHFETSSPPPRLT